MNSADTLVKMMNSIFTMDQQTDVGLQAPGNRRLFYYDILLQADSCCAIENDQER
jgi:hypothetical protein